MEYGNKEDKDQLMHLFSIQPKDNTDKIETVKSIFNESGASKTTQEAIKEYTQKAFETLQKMEISEEKKQLLYAFGEKLMNRNV